MVGRGRTGRGKEVGKEGGENCTQSDLRESMSVPLLRMKAFLSRLNSIPTGYASWKKVKDVTHLPATHCVKGAGVHLLASLQQSHTGGAPPAPPAPAACGERAFASDNCSCT
jgi:hypothetical protein